MINSPPLPPAKKKNEGSKSIISAKERFIPKYIDTVGGVLLSIR